MQNAGLDESQAGIKIAGRNINSLRYTNVTTLMAERKDKLKSLLMRVKEESEKVGLMTCVPIASWQTEGEKVEVVTDLIFLGSKIIQTMTTAMKLKDSYSLESQGWQSLGGCSLWGRTESGTTEVT